jgi:hypothetical protein
MTQQSDQATIAGVPISPALDGMDTPALEQLLSSTRELYAETTAQFRDIGELAFMELELAIKSLQWGILALLMFGATSIVAFTFLVIAAVLILVNSSFSTAAVLVFCAGFSAIAAGCLYLSLRSLTKKMTFSNLRSHLTRSQDETTDSP